jgi:cysteine/glycine-rich protein
MSKFGGGGTKCRVCDKTAYPAETVTFEKIPYHADCFRCVECNKKITPGGAAAYEEKIYCRHDFEKAGFAQKQRQVKWTKKESTGSGGASKFGGGGEKCTICTKTVYSAETLSFEKKVYHPTCFKCTVCEKKLNTSEASSFEDDIICRKCFGAGGYTQKQTASAKQGWQAKEGSGTASKFGGGGAKCTICTKTVYSAETLSFEKKVYHPTCFKCTVCEKKLNTSEASSFEDDIICRKCFGAGGYTQKQTASAKQGWQAKTGGEGGSSKFGGGGNKCDICAKTVYAAETISFEKLAYHAGCFKCKVCERKITPSDGNKWEGDEGREIICTKCFGDGGYRQKQVTGS